MRSSWEWKKLILLSAENFSKMVSFILDLVKNFDINVM